MDGWMERGIAKSSEWSKERRGKLEKKQKTKNLFFHINYADAGAPCAAWDVCSKQRGAHQLERPPPPTQQPPFLFLLSCRIASTQLAVRSLLLHNFVSHKLYVLHLLPSYSLSFYEQTTAVIINNKRECWQECTEHRHREKERERERGKRRYMFIYLSISPYIWWLEVDFVLTYFVVKRGERALSLRVSFPHNCCQLGQPSPRGRGRGRIPLAGEAANTESPPSEAPLRGERRRTQGEEARRLVRV